jgi:hypothetical protein
MAAHDVLQRLSTDAAEPIDTYPYLRHRVLLDE